MTTNSNGGTLARALWEARRDGRQVRIDDRDRPRDEAGAYAMQRGITEASGYEIVGYKIGATAQVAMDLLGVSGPFFGPLYREAFRENDATIALPMAHSPVIEAEFAVRLAADLPQRAEAWTKAEVEAAVAWVGRRSRSSARASKAASPAPGCWRSRTAAPTSISCADRLVRRGAMPTLPPIP